MGEITTSITVQFNTSGAGGSLSAAIDDRVDGYNNGITSFIPGDSPAFLIYASSNVTIDKIESSVGTITPLGVGTQDITEIITFTNAKTASTKQPITSNLTTKWLGVNGGAVSNTETEIVIANPVVGVLKLSYKTSFKAYRLNNVPIILNGESSFPVVVFIRGTAT